MSTKETLFILEERNPPTLNLTLARQKRVKQLHPVIERLGVTDTLYGEYSFIISYSEEYGEEEGWISEDSLGMVITIYEELDSLKEMIQKKKELPKSSILAISRQVEQFENDLAEVYQRYGKYLLGQGYVFRSRGEYEETRYYAVHINYLREWEIEQYDDDIPDWVQIQIPYSVYRVK